jgi:hypothetical protein
VKAAKAAVAPAAAPEQRSLRSGDAAQNTPATIPSHPVLSRRKHTVVTIDDSDDDTAEHRADVPKPTPKKSVARRDKNIEEAEDEPQQFDSILKDPSTSACATKLLELFDSRRVPGIPDSTALWEDMRTDFLRKREIRTVLVDFTHGKSPNWPALRHLMTSEVCLLLISVIANCLSDQHPCCLRVAPIDFRGQKQSECYRPARAQRAVNR